MSLLIQIGWSLLGLFLDDEFLAFGIVGNVTVTALLSLGFALPSVAAVVLIVGNLLVLAAGVWRTSLGMRQSDNDRH